LSELQVLELADAVADLAVHMAEVVEREMNERKRDEFDPKKEIARWESYFEKKTSISYPIPNFFQVRVILPSRLEQHMVSCSGDTTVKTLLQTCRQLPTVERFKQARGEAVRSLTLRAYGVEQEWLENGDHLLLDSEMAKHWLKRGRVPVLLLAADPDMRMMHRVNVQAYAKVEEERLDYYHIWTCITLDFPPFFRWKRNATISSGGATGTQGARKPSISNARPQRWLRHGGSICRTPHSLGPLPPPPPRGTSDEM